MCAQDTEVYSICEGLCVCFPGLSGVCMCAYANVMFLCVCVCVCVCGVCGVCGVRGVCGVCGVCGCVWYVVCDVYVWCITSNIPTV